ncbi:hypothetical protein BT96DRAFT_955546 [Gymnopus androsaceus JB14]|uniref:BHLH domain-containing protein n=1 Tax=Gymnopus androsaceus JB14 TaxID=1447944 RepID=A0A6A4I738_9AGAR|nr:hypothetical protein BT96DRAFT_955546 [Gymnopus androsaceus JB14]
MPPPAAPASAFGNGAGTEAPESLIPVTPASIMNLGGSFVGLGGGLGNNSQAQQAQIQQNSNSGSNTNGRNGSAASTSTSAPAAKTTTKGTGKGANKNDKEAAPAGPATGTRKSGRRAAVPTRYAHQHPVPAPPHLQRNTIVPLKERKTSHKAAEQKRRDSLKTTFDDLRGLLPPIPLPNDTDSKSGAAAASLLPGALPPRGPPKAGGEGPNKGVSKLQLLICGNEYIRVLKGRVERRDEEVERLRREVRRLRARLDGNENGFEGEASGAFDDMLDLDRDLDAVEVLESMKASALGASASMNGGGMLAGVDEDIEED